MRTLSVVLEVTGAVLQRTDIEGASDFFEIDGTSVAAMQILWKLEERLGVRLSLNDFLDAPDMRAVAGLIDARCRDT